jgi:hypothetical protein
MLNDPDHTYLVGRIPGIDFPDISSIKLHELHSCIRVAEVITSQIKNEDLEWMSDRDKALKQFMDEQHDVSEIFRVFQLWVQRQSYCLAPQQTRSEMFGPWTNLGRAAGIASVAIVGCYHSTNEDGEHEDRFWLPLKSGADACIEISNIVEAWVLSNPHATGSAKQAVKGNRGRRKGSKNNRTKELRPVIRDEAIRLERQGLHQHEIAKKLNCSQGQISKLLSEAKAGDRATGYNGPHALRKRGEKEAVSYEGLDIPDNLDHDIPDNHILE